MFTSMWWVMVVSELIDWGGGWPCVWGLLRVPWVGEGMWTWLL